MQATSVDRGTTMPVEQPISCVCHPTPPLATMLSPSTAMPSCMAPSIRPVTSQSATCPPPVPCVASRESPP